MSRFPVVINHDFPLVFCFRLLAETSRGKFCSEWSHFGRPRGGNFPSGTTFWAPPVGKFSLTGHILDAPKFWLPQKLVILVIQVKNTLATGGGGGLSLADGWLTPAAGGIFLSKTYCSPVVRGEVAGRWLTHG